MDELELRTADGVDLFFRRWLAAGETRAAVIVAHGMSEHSGRYERLANALNQRGFAVYAPDHRGHGRTSGSTGIGRSGPAGVRGALADLDRLADLARSDVGDVPLVLFGHSMGSMLAHAYAVQHGDRLAGLALSGSPGYDAGAAELLGPLREAVDAGMGEEPAPGLASLNEAFEPGRTPYDWLSRDQDEVDAYIEDPYCGDNHPPTIRFAAELVALAVTSIEPEAFDRIGRDLPVLLLTGEADPVSEGGAKVRALEAKMQEHGIAVDAVYYPDARHEVLNEVNRDEVTADLVGWLERITGRAAGPDE